MVMKITYFVHGTTTDNEKDIATGWNPGELSKMGIEQSKKLKDMIKSKFDVIFCSDLKRSVDSAKLTFDKSAPIIQDKRLRECNYGKLNGTNSEYVDSLTTNSIEEPFPGGESYRDVEKRMRNFLKYIIKKYEGKKIAIVSHRGPQLALDVIVKGKTWEQAIEEDWRYKKAWKPGWIYVLKAEVI